MDLGIMDLGIRIRSSQAYLANTRSRSLATASCVPDVTQTSFARGYRRLAEGQRRLGRPVQAPGFHSRELGVPAAAPGALYSKQSSPQLSPQSSPRNPHHNSVSVIQVLYMATNPRGPQVREQNEATCTMDLLEP